MTFLSKDCKIGYLIGALLGDGCFYKEKGSKYPRIIFSSSDKDFIILIRNIISDVFGINLNIRIRRLSKKNKNWKDHYVITSRTLYKELSRCMASKKSIPKFIIDGDKSIKASFLSGFFDAEGGVSISKIKSRNAVDRRVHCTSNNLKVLKEIKEYLKNLEMNSFIQSYKSYYILNLWGHSNLTKFRDIINFKILRKRIKLERLIKSYKRIHKIYDIQTKNLALKIRKNHSLGATKIQRELKAKGISVSKPTIEKWIYGGAKKWLTKRETV